MVFHPIITGLIPTLEINGIEIERVWEFKNLGVILDKKFPWKSHTNILSNKISKYAGILNRLKKSCASVCYENTALQHGGVSLKLRATNMVLWM